MVHRARNEADEVASDSKSSATDMVTEFDRASERLIVDGILAVRPDDGIVGEEGTGVDGTSGVDWVIDPIDGTTNFVYGLPGYAVSVAATVDGAARVGAVYLPATDELFTAVAGAGARRNGLPIRCSTSADLATALVATGFAYDAARRAVQAARVALLLPTVRDIRRLGAAAADLCHLAAGRLDAYFEQGLGAWDYAAGALIASESGCRTAGAGLRNVSTGIPTLGVGAPGDGGWVIAAAPALFDHLTAALEAAYAAVPDADPLD
ncbi:MAG: hypothetical protein RJB61_89 [Actinomycetota bacterium]